MKKNTEYANLLEGHVVAGKVIDSNLWYVTHIVPFLGGVEYEDEVPDNRGRPGKGGAFTLLVPGPFHCCDYLKRRNDDGHTEEREGEGIPWDCS